MAAAFDHAFDRIRKIQSEARFGKAEEGVPRCAMIVLRSPNGWTGLKEGRWKECGWLLAFARGLRRQLLRG
jgi:phosphoketolase